MTSAAWRAALPRHTPFCAFLVFVSLLPATVTAQATTPPSSQAPAPSDGVVPAAVAQLPAILSLNDALQLLHTRGLDLLIADAAVRGAEGVLRAAAFVYNPQISPSVGFVVGYDPAQCGSPGCSSVQLGLSISDQAAVEDIVSGKRGLRIRAAHNALEAARMSRADAERQLSFQVRTLYVAAVGARLALDFARDTQRSMQQTVELSRRSYPGLMNEGDLARIEVQGLEIDQAVDSAIAAYRSAQVSLAFLLGVRGATVPDFDVDHDSLRYRLPSQLASATAASLLPTALLHRPDLRAAQFQHESALAAVALARRLVFPDIAIGVSYTQTGQGENAIQPPTLTFGLTAALPIFYQQQGEIMQAEANRDSQALNQARVVAQITSDVEAAFAGYLSARHLVERMEQALLTQARRARDITEARYHGGAGTLMDYLDSERTFIGTNTEYISDLANYWTAVYALQQAVGTDLTQ